MKLHGLDVFTLYHLKTSLFWFLEEKGIEFWGKNSLAKNIFNLLNFLIAFYARDCLPNYFISKNNMIDHRSSKEIRATCHALRKIRGNVTQYLCRYIQIPFCFILHLPFLLKESRIILEKNFKIVNRIFCDGFNLCSDEIKKAAYKPRLPRS